MQHQLKLKTAQNEYVITFENGESITTDAVIFGTGRQPNTDQLGLENTKVALDEKGYVKVDKFQNTTQNGIYAVGDVIGKIDLTPVAIALVGACLNAYLTDKPIYI